MAVKKVGCHNQLPDCARKYIIALSEGASKDCVLPVHSIFTPLKAVCLCACVQACVRACVGIVGVMIECLPIRFLLYGRIINLLVNYPVTTSFQTIFFFCTCVLCLMP